MDEISFYFLFDGNFPELSYLEFKCLISGISHLSYNTLNFSNEVLSIQVTGSYLEIIKTFQKYSRLVSLTKEIGLFYFSIEYKSKDQFESIQEKLLSILNKKPTKYKIPSKSTFRVEMIKRGIINEDLFNSTNRQHLVFNIADALIDNYDLKVDLKNEDILIIVFLTPNRIIFGQRLFKPNRKLIMSRTPSSRPYFHSGSMNPLLIRAMINLALQNKYFPMNKNINFKNIFLDPFMGAGGILMEAGTMGYETIGIELGYWMTRGARMNLSDLANSGYNSSFWTIIRSDSNAIPLKSNCVDIIVTDPPYGHSTILGGQKLEDLLHNVIIECYRVLKKGSRMVISIPSHVKTSFNNFVILAEITDRVHNSLTRIIYLLEKQ